jgi:starch phosphorylase
MDGGVPTYDQVVGVARNLRWTWKTGARTLFARLFPDASPEDLEWPLELLESIGRDGLRERLRADNELAELARAAADDAAAYIEEYPLTWFQTAHKDVASLEIAYFAAEFALTDSLPIFAGGLGAVAGELMKSASSLGIPLIGVGLLYQESSHQWIDEQGIQQESWADLDPAELPVELVTGQDGAPLTVTLPFPGRDVVVQIWTTAVGRNRLYLLDTDVESNSPSDRAITSRLYGGGLETRIQQELVLGAGGFRALLAVGHPPAVIHLNEGHAAFATLERIASLQSDLGLTFDEAKVLGAAGTVFTTHTPVSAGHDYFPPALAGAYLAPFAARLGIELETLLRLGRYRPDDHLDTFCPTVLALRLSDSHNGVSRLHGHITRQQWSGLWPRVPIEEVPIGHITNGIHLLTWMSDEFDQVLDREVGREWRTTPDDPEAWRNLLLASDSELWSAKQIARTRLVEAVRARRRALLIHRGADRDLVEATGELLDPAAFTIGFVGRFVAYKRPTLFLRDPERLLRLLSDPARPVQIAFAGKAHPDDESGKDLLRTVVDFAAENGLQNRIVFIEDFDTTADRFLARGVDLWLNTPRRPLEACGIGGMKAGANGAMNLSTLDGWWDEVWNDADPMAPPIGWCIGTAGYFEDHDAQDESDAESLYEQLEHDIVPRFYERDTDGLPRRWLASVRQSMATLASTWSSNRMVQQYVENAYLPASSRMRLLTSSEAEGARTLAREIRRFELAWPLVGVTITNVASIEATGIEIGFDVDLGTLSPDDVDAELWVDPPSGPAYPLAASIESRNGPIAHYRVSMGLQSERHAEFAARVLPRIDGAASRFVPGLIAWSH